MKDLFSECTLCPRLCRAGRRDGKTGYCKTDHQIRIARASLHMWEEPCISGKKGSGAVFFSGCSLRCVYCQNREISGGESGRIISVKRLADIFLELQMQNAANINLVTAAHYVPHIVEALRDAKGRGLSLPVVYNSSGYERIEILRLLEGYVDIYLPDFKYADPRLALAFSGAADYPETALGAIGEMVRQTGKCVFDGEGYIKRGTIVRHLILPGHTWNAIDALKLLHGRFGDDIYISIMSQYTPVCTVQAYPELNRRLTAREYKKVLDHAISLGIQNGYFQDGQSASESFIPPFDYEGVYPREQTDGISESLPGAAEEEQQHREQLQTSGQHIKDQDDLRQR